MEMFSFWTLFDKKTGKYFQKKFENEIVSKRGKKASRILRTKKGQKRTEMDENKWTKMDKNGQIWTKTDRNGQKCP